MLGTPGTFTVNRPLVNDMTDPDIVLNGSDSVNSITGGEDRMSSLAMESFTQGEASFPSCFHCHDTQATNAAGVPQARQPGSTAAHEAGANQCQPHLQRGGSPQSELGSRDMRRAWTRAR